MISEKKRDANRRNAEAVRKKAAERRVQIIQKMIGMMQAGPKSPVIMAALVGMNSTSVQEMLRRMRAAGVVRPYSQGMLSVRTWELCGNQAAIDELLDAELKLRTSETTNRRRRWKEEGMPDVDVSKRHITRCEAKHEGIARPWYIACLFGQPQSAGGAA